MAHNRRDFLKRSSVLAGSAVAGSLVAMPAGAAAPRLRRGRARMTLRYRPYTLQLRHVFTIATSSRTTTPVVLTEVEYDGVTGYGEASMPPYLGERSCSDA